MIELLAVALISSPATVEVPSGETAPSGEVTLLIVETVGYASDEGCAVLCLFDREGWSMPPRIESAVRTDTAAIVDLAAGFEVDGLPAGRYVAWVFHDADRDGTWDESDEYSGMSAPGTPPSPGQGPPGFDSLCFAAGGAATVVRITVGEIAQGPPEGGPPGGAPGGAGGPPPGGGTPPGGF